MSFLKICPQMPRQWHLCHVVSGLWQLTLQIKMYFLMAASHMKFEGFTAVSHEPSHL